MTENISSFVAGGNNSSSLLLSFKHDSAPLWMRIVVLIVGSIAIFVGGIGNFTILSALLIRRTRKVLWHFKNFNIFYMAVNDLVLTVFVCAVFVEKYCWFAGRWQYSTMFCNLHRHFMCYTFHGGLIQLSLVAYDRYLLVVLGAKYKAIECSRTVVSRIVSFGIVWPLVGCGCTENFNILSGFSVNQAANKSCLPEITQNSYAYIAFIVVGVFMPILFMTICYAKVAEWCIAKQTNHNQGHAGIMMSYPAAAAQKIVKNESHLNLHTAGELPMSVTITPSPPASPTESATKLEQKKMQAKSTFTALFIAVLMSNGPYIVLAIMIMFIRLDSSQQRKRTADDAIVNRLDVNWWTHLYELTFPIAWLNNAFNPLLYAYTMPVFKRAMQDVWLLTFKFSLCKIGWFEQSQNAGQKRKANQTQSEYKRSPVEVIAAHHQTLLKDGGHHHDSAGQRTRSV